MTALTAEQLVYTRVEPAYSPTRRGGYQSVYFSAGLSPADVEAIETRVQCFLGDRDALVRRQYFRLQDGRCVITRTARAAVDLEILDREGRSPHFAHCLVFSAADFARIEYNPFWVLDQGDFLTDARSMIQEFGEKPGVAPIRRVEVFRPQPPSVEWSASEARHVVELALQAPELMRRSRSLLLLGNAGEITEALRLAFHLLPPEPVRLECTFDTHIDRCPVPIGSFWAVGSSQRQSGSYLEVDAHERRVDGPLPPAKRPGTYWAWWTEAASTTPVPQLMEQAPTIQWLSESFEASAALPEDLVLQADACRVFQGLCGSIVKKRLEQALRAATGGAFIEPLAQFVTGVIELPERLQVAAGGVLSAERAAELAVMWLRSERPALKRAHAQGIQECGRRAGDWRLVHWASCLTQSVAAANRDEALAHMDEKTFDATLELLGAPLSPVNFVTPRFVNRLLAHPGLRDLPETAFVDLVEVVARSGQGGELGVVALRLAELSDSAVHRLAPLLAASISLAPDFSDALTRRTDKLPSPPGWARWLPWRRPG